MGRSGKTGERKCWKIRVVHDAGVGKRIEQDKPAESQRVFRKGLNLGLIVLFDFRLHRVQLLVHSTQLFGPRGRGTCILRVRGWGLSRRSRGLWAKTIQVRVRAL